MAQRQQTGQSPAVLHRLLPRRADGRVNVVSVVWACLLVLCNLLTLGCAWVALSTSADGSPDDGGPIVVHIMTSVTGLLAVVSGLLTFIPVVRHRLSEWWLAAPGVLLVVALARLVTVSMPS